MTQIKIHFYKGRHLHSRLIQLRTFSAYSHVSIEMDGVIYESLVGRGVVATAPLKKKPKSLVDTLVFDVPSETIYGARKWLIRQLGKKYDYMAVLAFMGFPRTVYPNGRWFCSELGTEFLVKCKIIEKQKILLSPGALYLHIK